MLTATWHALDFVTGQYSVVPLQAAGLLEEDPVPAATAESSAGISIGGADVLHIEDSGDALDIDLDDPFQAQMLDITQPIVADDHMLKCLKQQVSFPRWMLSFPGSFCRLWCAFELGRAGLAYSYI